MTIDYLMRLCCVDSYYLVLLFEFWVAGMPKGVTPKYSLKPLVLSLSDIKPDIDVEDMLF